MSYSQNIPYQSGYNQIEEQYQAHRWTSGSPDEGARDFFTRYASGTNQMTRAGGQSQKRYVTQVSQISNIGDGFKKTKYNQLETLKQLRQQYEILRNLPLQEEFLNTSHAKKQFSSSSYDSQNQEDSVSSSSKATNRKKKRVQNQEIRSTQILTLEKRQLQLVIGNSMRKIEELLNNQIEYKRTIHELQLQVDSRTSDEKIQTLTKTIKRNQTQFADKILNFKTQIQKLQQTIKQLQNKNGSLEADYGARGDELNRFLQEKRTLEDQLRVERDRYANLEIEIRRVTMESSIVEKDKNSQISRLNSLLLTRDPTSGEYKKLEQELRVSQFKYQKLLDEFERFKIEVNTRPKQVIRDNRQSQEQIRLFETLINHMREDSANQNRASIDLFNSMVSKLEERGQSKKGNHDGRFLEELFNLRNEVSTLKREKEEKSINGLAESVAQYQYKIQTLQQEISSGTISKQNLLKEYEIMKSSYNYAKQEYSALNDEYQKLKKQVQEGSYGGFGSSDETTRQLKRQLDQALFMVQKSKKQIDFNVSLVRGESQSTVRLLKQQISRIEGEKQLLKGQLNKMRAFYQSKIQQKNILIEKTTNEFSVLSESKQKVLFANKNNTEKQMNELIRKIQGMAELNNRYLSQSTYLSNIERELHELRYSAKRMKNINDGVDHLWSVKETQYHNVNEILGQLKSQ